MKSNDGSGDPTLPDVVNAGKTPRGAPSNLGYELGELLGRGGMGEVVLAHDPRIGRDVALKRMRDGDPPPDAIARFKREAKIQARLDHPAIVPVHEIGTDEEGRPFFTMKRLAGTTLGEFLGDSAVTKRERPAAADDDIPTGDTPTGDTPTGDTPTGDTPTGDTPTGDTRAASVQKLLRALAEVCLAIELAHSRRVVHRDLKPSNIMLGDYGEVYVLDWGVARVLDGQVPDSSDNVPSIELATQAGKVLGTPGYMAPEQVRGSDVGTAADVYALGSILFEILAGEPYHPRGAAALLTTVDVRDPSPARRRLDRAVPPELDAACVAALASDPAARPSARELGERIQRYLDGDRDLEQRRGLAARELAAARAALQSGDRAEAVRCAGRAVVLDPLCEAVPLLTSLIVEAPAVVPAEAAEGVAREESRQTRDRSRLALRAFLAFFLITPALPLMAISSWPMVGLVYGAIAAQIVMSFVNWRVRIVPVAIFMSVQLVVVVAFSRITSPLVLTPALIAGMLLSSTSLPWLNERRWAVMLWSLLAAAGPFVLEWVGVFAPTWELTETGFLVHGSVIQVHSSTDELLVVGGNIALVMLVGNYALGMARDRRTAQRNLYVQAWHLRQLLPRDPIG